MPVGQPAPAPSLGLPLLDLETAPAQRPPPADVSGDYMKLGSIGEGGMGQVELARQQSLSRDVAVKRLRQGVAQGTAFQSLLGEARTMGELEHPHIVPVHLLAQDRDGKPVLVMKRIEGVPWQRLLENAAHPFWNHVTTRSSERLVAHLEILMQVCNAVHFAHSRGIVHRDLKPENVMLGEFGELYVLDWGIAVRPAQTAPMSEAERTTVLGTPAFMAPEMVTTPTEVSPRTDVFLLGAILYFVLTGKYRHQAETLEQTLFRAFRCEPATYPDTTSMELRAICDRAMALRPDDRYASADELRLALVDYLRHRASRALSGAAERALDEVDGLLARPPADAERDFGRRVQALLIEVRVGFQQARREWPENPAAEQGFAAYLRVAFEYEIRLGNLEGARALFAESGSTNPEMKSALDQLVADKERQHARARKLSAFERDRDPRIGLGARRAMIGVLLVAASAIAVFGMIFRPARSALRHQDLVLFNLITLALWGIAASVFRKAIFSSALNRRGAGLIFVSFVLACGVRLLGWQYQIQPDMILHLEMWIYAALIASGAILFLPALWFASLPFVIGAALAIVAPTATTLLFAVAGIVGFVLAIYAWQLAPAETTQ